MDGCGKCKACCGWLFLIAGILFLLGDLGIWDFWGISWYTVVFLLFGVGSVAKSKCPACQAAGKGKGK